MDDLGRTVRATHRRCANCKGVFVKELASCSHCHSPADHFSFTAPAGELAGLARLYLNLARAASSTRRMGGPPNRWASQEYAVGTTGLAGGCDVGCAWGKLQEGHEGTCPRGVKTLVQ